MRIGRKVFRRYRIHLRKLNSYNLVETEESGSVSEKENVETDLEEVKSSSSDKKNRSENFSEGQGETLPDEGNGLAKRRQSKRITSKRHLHLNCVYYD